MKAKTGIASRALKRLNSFSLFFLKKNRTFFFSKKNQYLAVLGIVDPENNASTPPAVRASCGLDVFW